ncbi:hypothetical protein LXA43DRAFT_1097993 [Ganoderma leucocontextum]|nr:hypothetical protein LXA43DRAFT_1097993 [Ganoderma leucocontextum]
MSDSDSTGNLGPSTSNKRQRMDADEGPQDNTVAKDPEVWLSDGNIVFISQNTVFRVHMSVLSLHSEVFRDLFLLPMHLPLEAHKRHSRAVLPSSCLIRPKIFVNFSSCYYRENDETISVPCNVLCSLIRMGHKYAIHKVLNDALSRLKKYYTSDLGAWADEQRRTRYVAVGDADHLLAIEVAYLTNTLSILPTAFLEMCSLIERHIVTLSTCEAQCGLTAERVVQALNGKVALTANVTTRLLAMHSAVPVPRCQNQGHCTMIAQEVRRTVYARVGSLQLRNMFGHVWHPLYTYFWGSFVARLCPSCKNASVAVDEEMRQKAWTGLPGSFGLSVDGWPVN